MLERAAVLLRSSRFLRFIVAGAVNTLFGYAVYGAGILLGAPVWMALLAGTVAGTVFNFFTTGGYAFRQLALRRYPSFVACYLLVYAGNLVLLGWLSAWIADKLVAQAMLVVPMALVSYVLMARVVFADDA
jgi:putative flippase GtrA